MGPKAAVIEAARQAGRCAYHDFARWSLSCESFGVYGCDVQEFARDQFADFAADYSARLAALLEPTFRGAFESEAGKYIDELCIELALLTAAAPVLVVSAAPSPISGVVNTQARRQLARQMEG